MSEQWWCDMFDLLEKVLPIPEYPGLYYLICIAMFVRGCVLISEWYWARERARGPEYWQAMLDDLNKDLPARGERNG